MKPGTYEQGFADGRAAGLERATRILEDDAREKSTELPLRPRIVCLCGSTRFMEAFQKANFNETMAGNIVLSIGCDTKSDDDLEISQEDKERLDELHKRNIDLADEVYVLNVGGYIGMSTHSEILYAAHHMKPVRYLETHHALCDAVNIDPAIGRPTKPCNCQGTQKGS